ncbi:alpha/beta hydrolase [Adhaeretor mobilis]|nr:hypothetical protein [Adhaeretor mobilis]
MTHSLLNRRIAFVLFFACAFPAGATEVTEAPSVDVFLEDNKQQRYFLIGLEEQKAPPEGYGIVVVMPGGDGSADFNPFVKRIWQQALPEGYLVAQPVALKWTPQQQIAWPIAKNKAKGMKFSTEQFVEAILDDVIQRVGEAGGKINPQRIFTLTWSSSGPVAYAISLSSKRVKGSLIAMSVFKPRELPPLKNAKGHAYYLLHSRDDRVCPYRMAEQAAKVLSRADAEVTLVPYEGGHGWHGDVFGEIRTGVEWLEERVGTVED